MFPSVLEILRISTPLCWFSGWCYWTCHNVVSSDFLTVEARGDARPNSFGTCKASWDDRDNRYPSHGIEEHKSCEEIEGHHETW